VAGNKDWRFPTKKIFEEFNEHNINNLYKNLFNISKKNNNLLSPTKHEVNTRYATNN